MKEKQCNAEHDHLHTDFMRKLVCISESEGGDVVKGLRQSNASDWLSQNIYSKFISCHTRVVLLYVEHVTSLSHAVSICC